MGDGLYKRGKVWWFTRDPIAGVAKSSGKKDRRAAELEYARRQRLAADPDYDPEAKEERLNEWALKLLVQKQSNKSAGTANYYKTKLGHIVRIFGADAPITALRPKAFRQYVDTRRAESADDTTIGKEIGVAQTLARFAKREGAYPGDPSLFRPADFSGAYTPRERFLTEDELADLMRHLTPRRAAHVALFVALGTRFAEAFRIQPEHVDTERWTVFVPGSKTKRSKATVPVTTPFRELLLAALPWLPLERWLNGNMNRDLAAACRRAGIAKVTPNDLRRTHATWLSEAGVSDELIGKALRHSDGRMARKVYGQARPEAVGSAIEVQLAKTRQLDQESAEGTTQNPQIVSVAQSVEQRIEKPVFRLGDWAEAIANVEDCGAFRDPDVALGARAGRIVRYKNTTVLLPPTHDRQLAELIVEATNLAFDQERPGKLRKASGERILDLLTDAAARFGHVFEGGRASG